MAEQRVNAAGEKVEFNESSGRWTKVSDEAVEAPAPVEADKADESADAVTTEEAGTGDPAPGAGETMVDEGAAPQRRTRFGRE